MAELERHDIQGFLLSAYGHLPCATYLLLRVTDAASGRRWLARLADEVTTAERRQEGFSVNLALTGTGLTRLGLDFAGLASFPRAFREGMATEHRAQVLGDLKDSALWKWRWGNEQNPIDVLLLVFAADEKELEVQLGRQREWVRTSGGIQEVLALSAGRQPDTKEHFGFADGIGQPVIEDSGRLPRQLQRTGHATVLKAGEFIIGHEDDYGFPPIIPRAAGMDEFGRNGTYLVFRQLQQHVAEFWHFLDRATRRPDGTSDPEARERLGAKFVGRWMSGAPLVKYPSGDPHSGTPALSRENDFEYYEKDAHGFACPVGAHVRRANPRDALGPDPQTALKSANRHRILRRGRSYGNRIDDHFVEDGTERGLHFICLNGDLERQFEFIQQTWINNPTFAGLHGESDPLVGNHESTGGRFTVQDDPLRSRVHDLRSFVTVKGGAYFFLPSLKALRHLASLLGS
ncbi:MAG: Dyp-type peroxidase [Rubrivivax sp.]|nr:Dyp-type peroxidase [Pyrinomonadaceae bacterium]